MAHRQDRVRGPEPPARGRRRPVVARVAGAHESRQPRRPLTSVRLPHTFSLHFFQLSVPQSVCSVRLHWIIPPWVLPPHDSLHFIPLATTLHRTSIAAYCLPLLHSRSPSKTRVTEVSTASGIGAPHLTTGQMRPAGALGLTVSFFPPITPARTLSAFVAPGRRFSEHLHRHDSAPRLALRLSPSSPPRSTFVVQTCRVLACSTLTTRRRSPAPSRALPPRPRTHTSTCGFVALRRVGASPALVATTDPAGT